MLLKSNGARGLLPKRGVGQWTAAGLQPSGMLIRPTPVMNVRLAAASLVTLAFASGCGDDGVGTSEPGGDFPVVAHSSKGSGAGSEALVGGTLTMSDGCLLVGEYPVVWPHGTTWEAETSTVRLPDGQEVAMGDRVSGGGGYPYLSDLRAELSELLADCPMNEWQEVAMFNAQEQITVEK